MTVLWTPALIETALWLDAADAETLTLVDGKVSQWADKSGNDRHAVQGTVVRRPVLTEGGLNGLDTVSFPINSSSNPDFLDVQSLGSLTDFSILMVASAAGGATNPHLGNLFNNESFAPVLYLQSSGDVVYRDDSGAYKTVATGYTPSNSDEQVVIELGRSGSTFYGGANGYRGSVAADADVFSAMRIAARGVGGFANAYTKSVSEVVLFKSLIDSVTRQETVGYLAHKWGLAANLVSGHPYKSAAPTVPSLSGIITDKLGQPCQRAVYAVSRPIDGSAPAVLAHGLSDAVTGAYELAVPSGAEVTRIVVSEDDDPLLNDLVDRVVPE